MNFTGLNAIVLQNNVTGMERSVEILRPEINIPIGSR